MRHLPIYRLIRELACLLVVLATVHASAEAFDRAHPIYPDPASNVEASKRSVETVMALSEETLREWDPPLADMFRGACPNCDDGPNRFAQDFDWSPQDPDRVQCRYCEMWFPNDEYPLEHTTRLVSPAGTEQEYNYYERENGLRYYIEASMLNRRRAWLRLQAVRLARLYTATGEEQYAHKAGLIIARVAEVYPEMPIRGSDPDWVENPYFFIDREIVHDLDRGVVAVPTPEGRADARQYDKPYPYRGVRTGLRQWFFTEIPTALILAYDQIAPSLDASRREKIEAYFRATVNYCRAYPRFLSNMDPPLAYREIIAGRVIGEPEFVHGGIIRLERTLAVNLYADGVWREGAPGYGSMVMVQTQNALEAADGYTDPAGFRSTESGQRFDNFDPEDFAPLVQMRRRLAEMILPNGRFAAAYDTFYDAGRAREHFDPPSASRPLLHWAGGHGILGTGEADHQVQARLQFMGRSGHYHYDLLNLQLFAQGREMLSDIGYSHTRLRAFATSTLAHNTVMVDEIGQDDHYTGFGGRLLYFGEQHPDVQFISVQSDQAYEQTSLYQRSLALVRISEEEAYLVDLFEVEGGATHEWLLHGDADHDGTVEASLETSPREGTLLPEGESFEMPTFGFSGRQRHSRQMRGLVQDIEAGQTDADWNVTFRINPSDGRNLRTHMMAQEDTEVLLAQIPSIRGAAESNERIMDHWMPLVIARREGDNLSSQFLAVHEPYKDHPVIDDVGLKNGALLVEAGPYVDVHLFSALAEGEQLHGRYAFIRLHDDDVLTAYLADGEQLAYGDAAITLAPAFEGEVDRIEGRSVYVNERITSDDADRLYLEIPELATYAIPIEHVDRAAQGGSRVRLAKPAHITLFEEDGGKLTSYPLKKFEGPLQYRLPRSKTLE